MFYMYIGALQVPMMMMMIMMMRRPRYGGFRKNIAKTFGTDKLEWRGYPRVKKF